MPHLTHILSKCHKRQFFCTSWWGVRGGGNLGGMQFLGTKKGSDCFFRTMKGGGMNLFHTSQSDIFK